MGPRGPRLLGLGLALAGLGLVLAALVSGHWLTSWTAEGLSTSGLWGFCLGRRCRAMDFTPGAGAAGWGGWGLLQGLDAGVLAGRLGLGAMQV